MFGALEFSDKMAGAGIQPIIGAALSVAFADGIQPNAFQPVTFHAARRRIVLLAAGEQGYRNLMRLSSRAFLETQAGEPPHLKAAWLDGMMDGLIALTGGPRGPLHAALPARQTEQAAARLDPPPRLFGEP